MAKYDPERDGPIDGSSIDLRRLAIRLALRKMEALRIYKPLPFQQAFHESKALERLLIAGNRTGKTVCACVEVARAITAQDPYDKYPKKDGVWYCVGQDNREISQVLYPLLFRPGAFRMIRDVETKEWRVYRPDSEADRDRANESKPAPALVPKRFVKDISWETKKDDLPRTVFITTGWVIHFYSQNAVPTHGTAIDGALFDEEVRENDWYSEVAARLVDRKGRFIWSATPQKGTERLYGLYQRAEKQMGVWVDGKWTGSSDAEAPRRRTVESFFASIDDNLYMGDENKKAFVQKFEDDEENYRVRIGGEFALLSGLVFPEYSPRQHEVDPFEVPDSWTRYAAIDPGRQVGAVGFLAVPPPEHGDFVYLYDELYIKNCSAALFGEHMAKKRGRQTFRAFLIDWHGGAVTDTGSGKAVHEQYTDALKANQVRSTLTGFSFLKGAQDVNSGVEAIRFWLRIRSDGTSKLRIFRHCRNLTKEMKYYRNQKRRGLFIDKPEQKNNHLIDTLRYLVQFAPTWVPPSAAEMPASGAYAYYLREQEKDNKNGGVNMLLGLGAGRDAD